jgi:PAS domain S-box-containing protein
MAEAARPTRPAPLRRDAVLEAVTFAAERLLLATDWHDAIDEVLARFGIGVRVSRAAVIRVTQADDGSPLVHAESEWCAPGVPSDVTGPGLGGAPGRPGFERWRDTMTAGQPIVGDVDTFPPDERDAYRSTGVRSLAYYPITVEGEWWGCVGLEDREAPRQWTLSELDGARTAAAMLGAAIARQRQDERLRDAETRYRTMVEALPAVTYIDEPIEGDDINATMPFVSPQVEEILGYPPERFMQDNRFWFNLMHPDDYARMREAGDLSVSNLDEVTQEYRMRHADGSWVWVQDTSKPVYGDDGKVLFFQGFLMDVTTRHDAEERLREAERRFRILVEQMPAAIYRETVADEPGAATTIDYLSPQVERLLGYRPETMLGETARWWELIHPDDRDRVAAMVSDGDLTGRPFSMDYRMIAADGHSVWVHDEAILIEGDGGPAYWQGYLTDITERIDATERIRMAEDRYRQIVEHTPVITYQELPSAAGFDERTAMSYVSPQIQEILGYPIERWLEPGFWASVMEPEDLELERRARRLDPVEPYRSEYRMRAADGRVVWFHDEAQLITDIDGAAVSWHGVMVDITERREAEAELQRAQERLQALIDHIPAIVYRESNDEDPMKFFMSSQVEQMLGYTAEEWTWTPDFWVDRIHPDDRDRVVALDDESGRALRPYSIEYRFRRADGSYTWIQDEAVFLRSDPDDEGAWQGLLFDVTARKEAEEQLRASEFVQSATVEHLPAIVYREPPDGPAAPAMYVSPQVEQLLGYSPEEWMGFDGDFWLDHIHPDDVDKVAAANVAANGSREPFVADYRIRHADGSYRWMHDEATFVADLGDGWWQGFMIDVTARKEAEDQLRDAEERFRLIVERGPAVFYQQEFDPNDPDISRTTYVSPQQTELFGYTDEEMLADPTLWAKTIHPDDRDRVLAADIASNRNAEEQFSLEYRMISKEGRIVWVQDTCSIVRVPGKQPYWQGFLLDITERKHAEEQLARALEVEREATRRLRALDEMKNTFLQAVSHDLRTPLAAILGLAITLERGDVHLEEDDAKDLARRIAGNARRLDRLVTNLLDMDRLARGIVSPNLQPTDVGAVVRRVLAESELIPDSRLRTDIQTVMVRADGSKVERIVENLLANTARHTPATSTIWVEVRATDEGALLVVADDGAGVAEDLRDTIFEPFQQGPDAPRHSPGVGVGLTLVRRFAELHGGRAWVEDREGGGASFRVLLPYEAPSPIVAGETPASASDAR